jgi:hypothetical protein
MWTVKQRQAHDRAGLRYPSDLTEAEWGRWLHRSFRRPSGAAASARWTCARS